MAGTDDRLKRLLSASFVILTAAASAQAQPAPPAPQTQPSAEEEDVIVVEAERGDQTRIDRRVYTIANDPIAQTSTMLDVLARIPSVTVAPSGAVRLLGAGNVTIQVDGQPVPGQSLDAVLRSLTGSDIERIEVITNPSAQYSPQGEGGIINIITRQRFQLGLTGSTMGSAENTDSYQFNLSPTWTHAPWSFGVRLNANRGTYEGDATRDREDLLTGFKTHDDGRWSGGGDTGYGALVLGYRPNDRRRVNVRLQGFRYSGDALSTQVRRDDNGPVYNQTALTSNTSGNTNLYFDAQQSGAAAGELFKLTLSVTRSDNSNDMSVTLDPASSAIDSRYTTPTSNDSLNGNMKFDYERPFAEGTLLALGLALDQSDQKIFTAFHTLSGPPITTDYDSTLDGLQTTAAAYGTYQFRAGDWTLLPGVRVEQYRREVRSGGGESDDTAVDAFPSLHVRRNLAQGLDLDVSYSSRIARPQLSQLDPAVRFSEATRATSGNPNLDPTTTDAFEANLNWQGSNGRTFNLTLYDRLSDNIWSDFTQTTPSGVLLTMPVNAGESEQRGAQIILRGPVAHGWRYALSANLLQREFDVLQQGAISRSDEFEYSGNAQLEYRDRNQSEVGADHLQLELQFQGPQYYLQGSRDEFVVANFTWRRRLTDRIAGVFTVQDIFDSAPQINELRTDDFVERGENHGVGTRIRFALTYQFGSLQAQQQQGQEPGGGPPQ